MLLLQYVRGDWRGGRQAKSKQILFGQAGGGGGGVGMVGDAEGMLHRKVLYIPCNIQILGYTMR